MSFSARVKEEISKLNTLKDKQNVKAELIGYLLINNTSVTKKKIRFSTENEYNINRYNKLLNNLNINYNIKMQGNMYVITFCYKDVEDIFEIVGENLTLKNINIDKEENILKAMVRGSFLGAGSIANPNRAYHLEIVFSNDENCAFFKNIINTYNINVKKLKRGQAYSLYMKDGEEISKFLALIGASSSVIEFEEIRVLREMRNNVNRIVNCETANLNKTINASVKQIEDINLIKNNGKFNELEENLKEIADLRIENPEASLVELGKMLKKQIGKSGVNYRLKKISEIAEELKK